jgi:hypothetical protein
VAPEAQPPSYRREEKEARVRGEPAPEIGNVSDRKIVHQDRETSPCVSRRGTQVGERCVSGRVKGKHDCRCDDAIGKTGETSHGRETAEP